RRCFRGGSIPRSGCRSFESREVVADRKRDLLHRLRTDSGDLLELLGSHVGESFHRGNAGSAQLLDNTFAQIRDLIERSGRRADQGRHLLLDLLALLLFALDVDLPAQQLGSKTNVPTFFADSEREL